MKLREPAEAYSEELYEVYTELIVAELGVAPCWYPDELDVFVDLADTLITLVVTTGAGHASPFPPVEVPSVVPSKARAGETPAMHREMHQRIAFISCVDFFRNNSQREGTEGTVGQLSVI